MRKIIHCLLLLLYPILLFAQQDGRLDSSFGVNGSIVHPLSLTRETYTSEATQVIAASNGKIILFGNCVYNNLVINCLSRLDANGNLDSNFGTNGKVYLSPFALPQNTFVRAIVDSSSNFYLTYKLYEGANLSFGLLKYLPNGMPDSSFGNKGLVIYKVGNYANTLAAAALQAGGKIILAGTLNNGLNNDFLTVRFLSNGDLDSSFNGNGRAITSFSIGNTNEEAKDILIQADGKIVVAGDSHNGLNYDFGLVRYNNNGSLDSTFGLNGFVSINFSNDRDQILKIADGENNRILILGYIVSSSTGYNYAVRVLQNGQLDNTFGSFGKFQIGGIGSNSILSFKNDAVIVSLGGTLKKYFNYGIVDSSFGLNGVFVMNKYKSVNLVNNAFALTDSNHLVFGGYYDVVYNRSFSTFRLKDNGKIDFSFSPDSVKLIQMGSIKFITYTGTIKKMVVQADRKIVVAGSILKTTFDQIFVRRFLPEGGIDSSFGVSGELVLDAGVANSILPLPDNSLLLAGYVFKSQTQAILLKLKPNGEIDSSFATNGSNIVNLAQFNDLDLQSDGKIIASGNGLMRFHSNGQIDYSFNQYASIYVKNAAIQPDNKIVIASDTLICRFNANGVIDNSFAVYSKRWFLSCIGPDRYVNYGFLEPIITTEGNILVNGISIYGTYACSTTVNLQILIDKNGNRINEFGVNGIVIGEAMSNFNPLWLGNSFLNLIGPNGYKLKKYKSNGVIESNFGISGSITFPLFGNYLAFQTDSQIVVSTGTSLSRHYIRKDKLVDFSVTKNNLGLLSDTFQLHASGSPGISNYRWIIDNVVYLNGTDSSSAEPYIKFLSIGSKSIKLIGIVNEGEITEKVKSDFITVCSIDFAATSNFEEVLVPIQLASTSNPAPASYRWEIGGNPMFFPGYNLGVATPYFRYLDTGSFAVTLIAKYVNGDSLMLSKPNFFRINSLTFTQDKSYSNTDSPYFNFYAHSKPAAMRYVWQASAASGQAGNTISFPNGNALANVKVVVSDTGWYNMQLTAYYDSLNSLVEVKNKAFYVSAIPQTNKPVAAFAANKQSGNIDELFYFSDSSLFHPNSWEWTFVPDNVWLVLGDYHSQNPIVSFYANGIYDVKLKVGNPFGSDSLLKKAYIYIGVTGQSSLSNGIHFNLFPNPANDLLFLRFSQETDSEYQIYSSNGALVGEGNLNESINGLNQIDVSHLPSGFYQIRVKTESGETGKSFILSR